MAEDWTAWYGMIRLVESQSLADKWEFDHFCFMIFLHLCPGHLVECGKPNAANHNQWLVCFLSQLGGFETSMGFGPTIWVEKHSTRISRRKTKTASPSQNGELKELCKRYELSQDGWDVLFSQKGSFLRELVTTGQAAHGSIETWLIWSEDLTQPQFGYSLVVSMRCFFCWVMFGSDLKYSCSMMVSICWGCAETSWNTLRVEFKLFLRGCHEKSDNRVIHSFWAPMVWIVLQTSLGSVGLLQHVSIPRRHLHLP